MAENPKSSSGRKLTLKKSVPVQRRVASGIRVEIRRRRSRLGRASPLPRDLDSTTVAQRRKLLEEKRQKLAQSMEREIVHNRTFVDKQAEAMARGEERKQALSEEVEKRTQQETKAKTEQVVRARQGENHLRTGTVPTEQKESTAPGASKGPKKKYKVRSASEEYGRARKKVSVYQIMEESEREYDIKRGASVAAFRRRLAKERRKSSSPTAPKPKVVRNVTIREQMTVTELAAQLSERVPKVLKTLAALGVRAGADNVVDADVAELVVGELGHRFQRVVEKDILNSNTYLSSRKEEALEERPPVVTVVGHVDHGKTTLLDALRRTQVAKREHGGITQHLGAYQVKVRDGKRITFLDTPGHAAFTAMRRRGTMITDIALLVVAADDGVKPQTIEAIDHIKAADVPLIVVVNKVDVPGAEPGKVLEELLQHKVVAEKFGGEVQAVEISALQEKGLDTLVEAILLQTEMLDLRTDPTREGFATVLEAKVDRGKGIVASILVRDGTIRKGDSFLSGETFGRIRMMSDDHGKEVKTSIPSQPLEILGYRDLPNSADDFIVFPGERGAQEVAEARTRLHRELRNKEEASREAVDIFSALERKEKGILRIVLKADVFGSLGAIEALLDDMQTDEVEVEVVHKAVGGVLESDIDLASASRCLVIGFNVRASASIRKYAERLGVKIATYSVIYDLADDIRARLSDFLAPTIKEEILGHAEVRTIFSIKGTGRIAGSYVEDGTLRRGTKARVLRDEKVVYTDTIGQIKHLKADVEDIRKGMECGLRLTNFQDFHEGDVIEAFEEIEKKRSL